MLLLLLPLPAPAPADGTTATLLPLLLLLLCLAWCCAAGSCDGCTSGRSLNGCFAAVTARMHPHNAEMSTHQDKLREEVHTELDLRLVEQIEHVRKALHDDTNRVSCRALALAHAQTHLFALQDRSARAARDLVRNNVRQTPRRLVLGRRCLAARVIELLPLGRPATPRSDPTSSKINAPLCLRRFLLLPPHQINCLHTPNTARQG